MSWYFQCLRINAFLYKQHFCKQHQADILLFENYYMVSPSMLSSKNGAYSKERVIKQVSGVSDARKFAITRSQSITCLPLLPAVHVFFNKKTSFLSEPQFS